MKNQTSGKCHASETKVSFVFRSTKDIQEIPLANWGFCKLFLENEAQIKKTNYTTMLFMAR